MQRYYSNIYWHFTGSPENLNWHEIRSPKDILKFGGKPKSERKSLEIFEKIMKTRKLLAVSDERISEGIVTEKFCSVTDIPFKDLLSQKKYYGSVAIGFKPKIIHEAFLPVIYIPSNNLPVVEIISKNQDKSKIDTKREMEEKSEVIQSGINEMKDFLINYVKVTTFNINEEHSFYREREWRHIGDFNFNGSDVSAIVVPSQYVSEVRDLVVKYNYPPDISVISWDVIEFS